MMRSTTLPTRGFTMIEFIFVTAITGILILGLSAVIEVPRQMVENQQAGESGLASTDLALSQIERVSRYATDVKVVSPTRLELTWRNTTVVFERGADQILYRDDAQGRIPLLWRVQSLTFTLGYTPLAVTDVLERNLAQNNLRTADFTEFTLKPGFKLVGGLLGGLIGVVKNIDKKKISRQDRAGIKLRTSGLDGDDGLPASITVRLRRRGSDDLQVNVYEASGLLPNRSKPIAVAIVPNAAINNNWADHTISLSAVKKLKNNTDYFVEFMSTGNDECAEMEYQTLSIAAAAIDTTTGFLFSENGGGLFGALSSLLNASQAKFDLRAVLGDVQDDGTLAGSVKMIPTTVQVAMTVAAPGGPQSIEAVFPIENKLALVNQ